MRTLEENKEITRLKSRNRENMAKARVALDAGKYAEAINWAFPAQTLPLLPEKYNEIKEFLETSGTMIDKIEDRKSQDAGNLAYVFKEDRGEYKEWVNPCVEELAIPYEDLHEWSHIYLNHLRGIEDQEEIFATQVNRQWSKIRKFFSDTVLASRTREQLIHFLFLKFENIAKDLEINSKLFEDPELRREICLRQALFAALAAGDDFNLLTIKKEIIDRVENNHNSICCCYPYLEEFPDGLPWMTYMIMLIDKLEEYVQKIAIACDECESDGMGGIGMGAVEKSEKGEEARKEKGDNKDSESGMRSEMPNPDPDSSGHMQRIEKFETIEDDDLEKVLRRHLLSKQFNKIRTDPLYHDNHGQTYGGIILPKRWTVKGSAPCAAIFLVDVSGSIMTDCVRRIISSTVAVSPMLNKAKSRIICWDTDLLADYSLYDELRLPLGGGNDCKKGMKYLGQYIKSRDDKIFWITDGGDYLHDIAKVAEKYKCYKAAIHWVQHDFYENDWSRMNDEQKNHYEEVFDCISVLV
jgi:hypothetical protein